MPKIVPPSARKKAAPATKRKPLCVPQVRILKALARVRGDGGLSKTEIATRAEVSPSMTANLGSSDPAVDATIEARYGKVSLHARGLVRPETVELDGGTTEEIWLITAKGRQLAGTY